MTSPVSLQARRTGPPAPARSVHVITELSRLAACGCCAAAGPVTACVQRAAGADGMHIARYAAARRRGLITAADFAAVIDAAGAFTPAAVVYDDAFAEAA